MVDLIEMGKKAREAAYTLALATTKQKNLALRKMAEALELNADHILAANRLDLDDGRANGLSAALLDRLDLQKRLPGIAADVGKVADLPDPVGVEFDVRTLDNGLEVSR